MKSLSAAGLLAARLLGACVLATALLAPVATAEPIYPMASRIGLIPPAGMKPSEAFIGFEDRSTDAFIRLIALPGGAFAEIEKTMTNDALRKQGMTVEKRETLTLPSGKALLVIARQEADAVRIQKWLLIAPLSDITALVSFEMPAKSAARYPEAAIRAALATVAARATVPDQEQLALLPFRVNEMSGMRLVRVMPGMAVQLTDGPKDLFDGADQSHLVISIAPGGPQRPDDRDNFARLALTGLPPLKDMRLRGSEPMRIGGQPGHEIRAEAKDPSTGADIEIVQWLRFGSGGFMRVLGFGPKEKWPQTFTRFRAVRDGLEAR